MADQGHSDIQTLKTVMIPVDGSTHSKRAFDWYCDNLHKPNDQILFVHVVDVEKRPVIMHPHGMAFREGMTVWMAKGQKDGKELLESYAKTCRERKYNFKLMTQVGRAGHSICQVAEKEHADHMVMGSRGLGTVRRTLMGSVSDFCLHHSHIPVSVVPPTDPPTV